MHLPHTLRWALLAATVAWAQDDSSCDPQNNDNNDATCVYTQAISATSAYGLSFTNSAGDTTVAFASATNTIFASPVSYSAPDEPGLGSAASGSSGGATPMPNALTLTTQVSESVASLIIFPNASRNPSDSPLPTVLKPIPPESAILVPTTAPGSDGLVTAGTLTAVPCDLASNAQGYTTNNTVGTLSLSSVTNGYCAYVTVAPTAKNSSYGGPASTDGPEPYTGAAARADVVAAVGVLLAAGVMAAASL